MKNNYEIELLEEEPTKTKPKKIKKTLPILIVISILLVGSSIVFIPYFKNNQKTNKIFFLKNANNLYAIFDSYGNKLSEFIYNKTSFNHGSALVKDKDGSFSIISEKGKTLVNNNEYNYIERRKGIYLARLGSEVYLLNSSGKVKYKINNSDILFYGIEDLAILKRKDEYLLINQDGDIIQAFKIESTTKPMLDYKDNYVIIYYNDKNYIIDIKRKKLLNTINENQRYCISSVNESNPQKVIVYSCISNLDDEIKYNFKVINSGKIEIEKNSSELSNLSFVGNNILYSTTKSKNLLDNTGKENLNIKDTLYIDNNHYAKLNEETNTVDIYVDNKVKKKTECRHLSNNYAINDIYLLEKCNTMKEAGYFAFYNKDGQRIGNKNYVKAINFDENALAIVSEDGSNYYLIDNNGNQISKQYKRIEKLNEYYEGISTKGTELYNKTGKVLIKGDSIIKKDLNNGETILLIRRDKKYLVYNLTNEKEITTVKSVPIFENDYFVIKEKKSTKYYSYITGNNFYSE